MKNHHQNLTARTAGLLYTLMIPLGAFGILFVPASILVSGDMDATIQNVLKHIGIFRTSILCALIVQITHIFIVLLLHKLLSPVNKRLADLMVIFMLISIPIAMVNELTNYGALIMVEGYSGMDGQMSLSVKEMVRTFFDMHKYGILIAGFFWGLWLIPMGLLVYKSKFLPKAIGILLLVSGCGYVLDSILRLLLPIYGASVAASIVTISLYGEITLPLWLLIRGTKAPLNTA